VIVGTDFLLPSRTTEGLRHATATFVLAMWKFKLGTTQWPTHGSVEIRGPVKDWTGLNKYTAVLTPSDEGDLLNRLRKALWEKVQ